MARGIASPFWHIRAGFHLGLEGLSWGTAQPDPPRDELKGPPSPQTLERLRNPQASPFCNQSSSSRHFISRALSYQYHHLFLHFRQHLELVRFRRALRFSVAETDQVGCHASTELVDQTPQLRPPLTPLTCDLRRLIRSEPLLGTLAVRHSLSSCDMHRNFHHHTLFLGPPSWFEPKLHLTCERSPVIPVRDVHAFEA